MPALLWLAVKFLCLLAGLLAPGAALMRALGLPRTVATCFAGSVFALYATVLALALTGLPIVFGSLVASLVVVSVAAGLLGKFVARAAVSPSAEAPERGAPFRGLGRWAPLYVLFWIAALWRAWHEPLAGPDVEFRWGFLAEQMLALGSLDFYPPRSAADFLSYFWAESIPPGASALHAWAFACAGRAAAAWTVPAVVLQLWALHELLWRAASRIGGVTAGRFACLAAAACPLLTWSVLLGQETGLTAVALAGLAFALLEWHAQRTLAWAALAGLFATIGAAAREYGLIFPAFLVGGLLVLRADRRTWGAALGFAALSLVWPLRTFALTGNPIFSLPLAGLPTNPRFLAWIEHDAPAFGAVLHTGAGWRDIARYFMLFAPAATLGGVALLVGALRSQPWRRASLAGLVAGATVLGLWLASVRYTNGGLFYSMRVTSPALALGALACGVALAFLTQPAFRRAHRRLAFVGQAALVVFTLSALGHTLALPRNAWRTPWREWPAFVPPATLPAGEADETVARVLSALRAAPDPLTPSPFVLADAPGFQRRFAPAGVKVLPLWSPQADWLFDASLPPAEAARRWRASGIRFLILTKWQANVDFFNAHSRWSRPPFHVRPIAETPHTVIFVLHADE